MKMVVGEQEDTLDLVTSIHIHDVLDNARHTGSIQSLTVINTLS